MADALYINSLEDMLWDGAVLEGLLGVHVPHMLCFCPHSIPVAPPQLRASRSHAAMQVLAAHSILAPSRCATWHSSGRGRSRPNGEGRGQVRPCFPHFTNACMHACMHHCSCCRMQG